MLIIENLAHPENIFLKETVIPQPRGKLGYVSFSIFLS